jgi:hypothetical protein
MAEHLPQQDPQRRGTDIHLHANEGDRVTEEKIVPTIPEDYKPAAWLTMPKYSKLEIMWLCEKLDHSNHELRQALFRTREQLRRMEDKA